jgi:3-mercaptopyruvate sulfurtransferase SseA
LIVFSLFISVSVFAADYANPQLLVTPADIEKNMGKWVVIDCRDAKATTDKKTGAISKGYSDGHIPGAINLGSTCGKVLRKRQRLSSGFHSLMKSYWVTQE